tara:strand:+ start:101 stop:970 length:870 start_codon:yes stop_codon:yes gene_type:complete
MHIILYTIIGIIFSFSSANTIGMINGNMQAFSSMNSGSFINKNYQQINYNACDMYSMSFIQLPAEIKFHEIFFQKSINNYIISSRVGILSYGTLQDESNNEFSADQQILRLSIFNIASPSFTYGASLEYHLAEIENYNSSLLSYSIGFNKSYFDNRFIFGFSLENYIHTIESYSNVIDLFLPTKKIITSYKPKFLPLNIMIDYSYKDINNTELGVGIQSNINNKFYLYSGKRIYLNDIDDYNIFSNLAFGSGTLITNKYKIDFGIQYLTNGVINIGTSFSIIELDNFEF